MWSERNDEKAPWACCCSRVSALDLLWGKLGASGLTGFCALAAFSPLLTIPILGGGVTGERLFAADWRRFNTLFISLAVGLFTSVWRQVSGLAAAWAFGLTAVLVALPWVGTWLSLQAIIFFSLGLRSLLLELLAILWAGLWFGLTARSQTSAIFWTVGLAEGAIGLVRIVATAVLFTWVRPSGSSPPWFVSYGLTCLPLVLRLGLVLYARSRGLRRLNARDL